MIQKIGIFSGTFDPIHKGHVAFAKEAQRVLRLDKVVYLPEIHPRGKSKVSPIAKRVAQINKAVGNTPLCTVKIIDTPKLTYKTAMSELSQMFPNANFVLLIGSDVAMNLTSWTDTEQIIRSMPLAIGLRHSETVDQVENTMDRLHNKFDISPRYHIIRTSYGDVSSSMLRGGTSSHHGNLSSK